MTIKTRNIIRTNAGGRPSGRERIADYILTHYALHKQPVCVPDIIAAAHVSKDTASIAVRALLADKVIKFVGIGAQAKRDDLISLTIRMYAPYDAPMLVDAPIVKADGTVKALVVTNFPAYLGKPAPLSEPRAKTPRYKGEEYVRPWPVSGEDTGRKPSEFWSARDLAILTRTQP